MAGTGTGIEIPTPSPLVATTLINLIAISEGVWTELTTVGNRLTTWVGASGRALVSVSAELNINPVTSVILDVYANGASIMPGGSAYGIAIAVNSDGAMVYEFSVAASRVASVTPNASILWQVFGQSLHSPGGGAPAVCTNGTLIVQPL